MSEHRLVIASDVEDAAISVAKLAATLKKGIVTVPLSFETNEVGATKVYFPFAVTINKIRGTVNKVIEATDDGTIQGANSTGDSDSGLLTAASSDVVGVEYSASPTTNNTVVADSYYKLTSAKSTAGGRVISTLEFTRT